MKLKPLDSKKQAEIIAIAQAQEFMKSMDTDGRDALWRKEHQQAATAFLMQNNYSQYYRYDDRHGINVRACWWERDGYEGDQLVLFFGAMYAGTDMDQILDPCKDEHWVYYWVEADGTLTWATDEYNHA
jgi:hypothetical protein